MRWRNGLLRLKTLHWSVFSPAKAGAAQMAAHMITRGTKTLSAEQLAEELELNAISLEGNSSLDTADVQADCLTEHADRAARLLAAAPAVVIPKSWMGVASEVLGRSIWILKCKWK